MTNKTDKKIEDENKRYQERKEELTYKEFVCTKPSPHSCPSLIIDHNIPYCLKIKDYYKGKELKEYHCTFQYIQKRQKVPRDHVWTTSPLSTRLL